LKLAPASIVAPEQKIASGKLFTFLNAAGLTFVAVSPSSVDKKRPVAFLETVSRRWAATYGPVSAKADSHGLNETYMKNFIALFQEYNKSNRTEDISRQLHETESIMKDSVGKALGRGEDLDSLSLKSEELLSTSEDFRAQATNLKWKMRWEAVKSWLWTTLLVGMVVYVVLTLACGGWSLKDCR
jgi:vesicle-associated membrane protein 7